MDGLLIIDKPQGITSFDVVRRVRRILGIRRVGHTGTLDPLATGLLPVAVGEGTRIVQFLMEGDKTYRATLKLGETTDTQDAEGVILERRPVEGVTGEMVRAAAESFRGEVEQVPPMYSALKKDGVPLHRLARKGIEIDRPARTVRIDRMEILEVRLPSVTLEVDCSKGTYVRTLCHDLGQMLGTGAHLTSLRRLRCGPFAEAEAMTLEELDDGVDGGNHPGVLPLDQALRGFPALQIEPEPAVRRLRNGVPPAVNEVAGTPSCREGETVVLLDADGPRAVARFAPSREREKRGDFELLKVFSLLGAA